MWKILKQQTKYMPNLSKGKEYIPRTRIGFYHFAMTFTFAFHLVTTRLLLKNLFIWNTSHIRLSREYTSICLKGIFFYKDRYNLDLKLHWRSLHIHLSKPICSGQGFFIYLCYDMYLGPSTRFKVTAHLFPKRTLWVEYESDWSKGRVGMLWTTDL